MILINFELPRGILLSLCAGFGALLCLSFSYAVWVWHTDWALSHQVIAAVPINPELNQTQSMIDALPETHLFGQAVAKGLVPTTNLQLQVNGIVKVKDEKMGHSKAYISVSNQPSKIFQMGDTLVYGVKIYDITADTVILENDGHLEKLTLTREKLEFKPLVPINSEGS